ncbi:MAG: TetR/AcrR family transcriptional regulator [Gordonia sp.]|nr:TetR/AcrR family transcriptional regulator [Gordonia sp. (in: high G+C Gram-positive bacteria)]
MPTKRPREELSTARTLSESTRDRIEEAAFTEFARYGIAGARMDRIAKEAKTSKERIYAYFRSKEHLYGQTAAREFAVIADAAHLDPGDLPEYAGVLFDYFAAHPDRHRLIVWGRLELTDPASLDDNLYGDAIARKASQIAQAQREGRLPSSWDPNHILALINQIATTWASQPEFDRVHERYSTDSMAERRVAVVRAVAAIFPAADST